MKITIAIDSFKGSLNTFESGKAVAEAARTVFGDVAISILPLADGGEGTVDAIASACGGEKCSVRVSGPLGRPVAAEYAIINGDTAIIEMSAAAGITLIDESERNPMLTTTYGVGEMIAHAIKEKGCRKFIIGIGGSATNDGGVGMLMALGFGFFDKNGKQIKLGAKGLEALCSIDISGAMPQLSQCEFRIACDVTNPLCGEKGCSAVYGPQKGADPEMISKTDAWLASYALLTENATKTSFSEYPGAGAAGGLGFAFLSFLGGKTEPGIGLVSELIGLEDHIKDSDIIITGEGRLDGQSAMGKAPIGVAKLAKKHQKRVIAFCGCATDEAEKCNEHGIDAFFPILRNPCSLSEAMDRKNAYDNLKRTAIQVFRLIK